MTRMSVWMTSVLVVISAFGTVAQTSATDKSQVPGMSPSGFGEAVDRDIMKVRNATARF